MTSPARAVARPLSRSARWAVGTVGRARRDPPAVLASLAVLSAVCVLLLLVGIQVSVGLAPPSTQALPLLVGGLLLDRRTMRALLVVVVLCLAGYGVAYRLEQLRPGGLLVVAGSGLVAYAFASSREQTGLTGRSGDSLLVELRRRLQQQGRVPALPRGWQAEAVVRPAGGGPFAGDFVVAALTGEGRRLELALVDVSGKGLGAGTRALLLSGAMGGLLGTQQPADFLPAANAYLVRQDWDEGFATAVHLAADLVTGDYTLTSAGHPPVAHFDAGTGTWSLMEASGVVLGLLPDVSYTPLRGRLDRGDALLLYTDGLVEIPGRDLSVGIDKLLGEAERLVPRGFTGGADTLVTRCAGASPDDRGLVLLWRAP